MEIKAKSRYNYKVYKKMYGVILPWTRPLLLILAAWYTYLGVFSVISVQREIVNVDISKIPTILLVDAFIIVFAIFLPKMNYKLTKIADDIENEYVFEDEGFCVVSKGEDYYVESKIGYKVLKSAYETRDYIFLLISKRQTFVVEKNSISAEDRPILREVLLKKLGKKYKLKLSK